MTSDKDAFKKIIKFTNEDPNQSDKPCTEFETFKMQQEEK